MTSNNVATIIFDLGGVIIDLDVSRTLYAFAGLTGLPLEKVEEIYSENPVFVKLETGTITAPEFREEIRHLFESENVTDAEIDTAWNAMLLGVPRKKLDLMAKLKRERRVIILSNTNVIHVSCIHNRLLLQAAGVRSFEPFAHKVYYSNDLGMRKPDPEIFKKVLTNENLVAEETIFLDDNPDNISAAQTLGIQAKFVAHPEQVFDLVN